MKRGAYISVLLISIMGCKKPYSPAVITNVTNFLVVEGMINTGPDSTIIKLSRTVNLSAGITANPETGASLAVESDANNTYPLTETKSGYYTAALNLDNTRKYRLRITTSGNQQYLSDFVPVKVAPPVDSVGFIVQGNSVQIYANTHDPQNSTHYYRWDYTETWEFHSLYQSTYVTNGQAIVPRKAAQLNYYCWATDTSSTIVLGSSAKLQQDVIYQNPITSVASTSEKIEMKYSILVKQYALTTDAYNFWTNLKKNTEQLGSIFDAQPSQINGNVHNVTNASEPVVGYISAGTVQTKRIFISNSQLPRVWQPTYPYVCEQDSALYCHYRSCQNDVAEFLIPLGSTEIPISQISAANGTSLGFFGSSIECVDCTIRGKTKQPDFWK